MTSKLEGYLAIINPSSEYFANLPHTIKHPQYTFG